MNYIKHLIECQCVLSIFKNKSKPIYHKFPVFSLLDTNDNVQEKYVICDNCGIIHNVTEISISKIMWGKENLRSLVVSKDDVKFNLENLNYNNIVSLLEKNQLSVADWEIVEFLIENKQSGIVLLNKEEIDNNIITQFIEFNEGNFKIKKEIMQRYV